jgi:hypothetical protein
MSANGDPVVRLDRQTGFIKPSFVFCRMNCQNDRQNRTGSNGLASCEALPGHTIGGTEENHEILQLIQAVS